MAEACKRLIKNWHHLLELSLFVAEAGRHRGRRQEKHSWRPVANGSAVSWQHINPTRRV